jgi:hypothetical protein
VVSTHTGTAEHIDFHALLPRVLALGVTCAKDAVPEQGHFLLERPFGVDHAENPLFLLSLEGILVQPLAFVAHHNIVIEVRLRFGMQQLLNGCLVAFGGSGFYFRNWGSESSTAHQMSH